MLGTFFTITSENTTDLLATIGNLFSDFKPIFFIIIGITLAILIIDAVISIFHKQKEEKRDREEDRAGDSDF